MKTENRIPNRKVIVGALSGVIVGFLMKYLGEGISPDMKANIMILAGGAAYFIMGYVWPPAKGDGIVSK